MKVMILSPGKVILAGVVAALLVASAGASAALMMGALRSEPAEAYKWPSDGGEGVGAKSWYFAEGYTGPGFEEWILIYNPPRGVGGSGESLSPIIEMYGKDGFIGRYDVPTLLPGQRYSVDINSIASSLCNYSGDISIYVYHPQYPFICERAMYWEYKGKWAGGSTSLGYQEAETGR